MNIAGLEIQNVNLIKRVLGLPFALKNQRLAIRRKITLSTPFPLKDELPHVRNETPFRGGIRFRSQARPVGNPQKRNDCYQSHRRIEPRVRRIHKRPGLAAVSRRHMLWPWLSAQIWSPNRFKCRPSTRLWSRNAPRRLRNEASKPAASCRG